MSPGQNKENKGKKLITDSMPVHKTDALARILLFPNAVLEIL
jgi:hypothetical protein